MKKQDKQPCEVPPQQQEEVIEISSNSSQPCEVPPQQQEEIIEISSDSSDNESVVFLETIVNANAQNLRQFHLSNKRRRKIAFVNSDSDAASSTADTATTSAAKKHSSDMKQNSFFPEPCTTKKKARNDMCNINRATTGATLKRKNRGSCKQYFLYSEDAEAEQERLFREAAERVRKAFKQQQQQLGHEEIKPEYNSSSTSPNNSCCFQLPIDDVSKLPHLHWMLDNPYYRLGLPDNSALALVKKHYRKLALQYHPDKNKNIVSDDVILTNKRFHAIKEAYESIRTKECTATSTTTSAV